jgi:hypothetical protein
MGGGRKRSTTEAMMLNAEQWLSFEHGWTRAELDLIEKRLRFLQDILDDALTQFDVEDVRSELDLNLLIYLNYFQEAGNNKLTSWLLHDSWFNYYRDGRGLSPQLKASLARHTQSAGPELRSMLKAFRCALGEYGAIATEADAATWVALLDYFAVRLLHRLAEERVKPVFEI